MKQTKRKKIQGTTYKIERNGDRVDVQVLNTGTVSKIPQMLQGFCFYMKELPKKNVDRLSFFNSMMHGWIIGTDDADALDQAYDTWMYPEELVKVFGTFIPEGEGGRWDYPSLYSANLYTPNPYVI